METFSHVTFTWLLELMKLLKAAMKSRCLTSGSCMRKFHKKNKFALSEGIYGNLWQFSKVWIIIYLNGDWIILMWLHGFKVVYSDWMKLSVHYCWALIISLTCHMCPVPLPDEGSQPVSLWSCRGWLKYFMEIWLQLATIQSAMTNVNTGVRGIYLLRHISWVIHKLNMLLWCFIHQLKTPTTFCSLFFFFCHRFLFPPLWFVQWGYDSFFPAHTESLLFECFLMKDLEECDRLIGGCSQLVAWVDVRLDKSAETNLKQRLTQPRQL